MRAFVVVVTDIFAVVAAAELELVLAGGGVQSLGGTRGRR